MLTTGDPARPAATLLQGFVEGTMELSAPASDSIFNEQQNQLLADIAKQFDAWLVRVSAWNHRPEPEGPPNRYGRFAAGEVDDATRESTALVNDLARLCRGFILRELFEWGFLLRRHGMSIDEVIECVGQRADACVRATYEKRWQVGLRQINWGFFKPVDGGPWSQDVWTMAIDDISELVVDHLRPALEHFTGASLAQLARAATEPNRELVEQFRMRVLRETGERVNRNDIALVAGYDDRVLRRFQCHAPELSPVAEKAFMMTLEMASEDFLSRLNKKREPQNRRPH